MSYENTIQDFLHFWKKRFHVEIILSIDAPMSISMKFIITISK